MVGIDEIGVGEGAHSTGPVPVRLGKVNFFASPIGDLLNVVRKRLVLSSSLMFSTVAILHFTALTVRGGGTDISLMRPRKGSPAAKGTFEGIAPSSAKIR